MAMMCETARGWVWFGFVLPAYAKFDLD